MVEWRLGTRLVAGLVFFVGEGRTRWLVKVAVTPPMREVDG